MAPDTDRLDIFLSPRRVLIFCGAITAALVVAHLAIVVGSEMTGHPLYYLPRLFDLGQEANLPTYVSALFLLTAATLLSTIAVVTHRRRRSVWWGWVGLALGFGVMSLDEAAQIHDELVGAVLYRTFDEAALGGHYTWYLVYVPLLVVLAVIYIPFLRSLPKLFLALFLASGALYVGGAVGVEIFEASLVKEGASPVALHLSKAVEEGAELLGVTLFIYSLLRYLCRMGIGLEIHFIERSNRHSVRVGELPAPFHVGDRSPLRPLQTKRQPAH